MGDIDYFLAYTGLVVVIGFAEAFILLCTDWFSCETRVKMVEFFTVLGAAHVMWGVGLFLWGYWEACYGTRSCWVWR